METWFRRFLENWNQPGANGLTNQDVMAARALSSDLAARLDDAS